MISEMLFQSEFYQKTPRLLTRMWLNERSDPSATKKLYVKIKKNYFKQRRSNSTLKVELDQLRDLNLLINTW